MSGHEYDRYRELERRLDAALDALSAGNAPEVVDRDDPEFLELLDAARVAHSLREPAWPDDGFATDLSARLAREMNADAGSIVSDNGHRAVEIPPPVAIGHSRRRRGLLMPIAALLRVLGSGMVAGMAVGLVVGGAGSRLAMYISGQIYLRENPGSVVITESSGQPVGSFSWSGTMDLLIEGMFTGALGGLFYVAIRRWLPGSPRWHGAIFGLFLLLVAGSMTITSGNEDFSRIGSAWLNVGMFALIFVIFGVLVAPLANRVDRWTSSLWSSQGRRSVRKVLAAMLVMPLGAFGTLVATALIVMITVFTAATIVSTVGGGWSTLSAIGVATALLVIVVLPVASALASPIATPIATHLPWLGDRPVDHRRATLSRVARYAFVLSLALGLILVAYNVIGILAA